MSLDAPSAVHWTLSTCASTLAASFRIPSAVKSVGNSRRKIDAVDDVVGAPGADVLMGSESGGGRGPERGRVADIKRSHL